ncbi:MAG: hypothetical protein WBL63_22145 [Candidatus Acidiferrum sp.]
MAETKQKKQVIALVALLLVAGLVWYFSFGTPRIPSGSSPSQPYAPINAEDYSLIFEHMNSARSTEYKSSGRNIFIAGPPPPSLAQLAALKPVEPPPQPVGPMPPPEPPPPTLAMKFFGYGTLDTKGPRRAFLLDGEEVHIVQEGDTILNHIRITHIGNDRIEYQDINTGKKNSSNLEMPPPV